MTVVKTIVQTWLDRCRATPHQTALREKRRGIWRSISWHDYHDAVLRIATGLERAGLRRGEVVSIVSESRPEWLYVDMAAQALGCISHGAYPTCPPHRVVHQLALAGARVVFVDNADQAVKILEEGQLLPALERIVVFDARGLGALNDAQVVGLNAFVGEQTIPDADRQRLERWVGEARSGDVAFLASTAGSSGTPRLAAIDHDAALRRAVSMQNAVDVRAGDRVLCFVPLANVAERMFSAVLPLLLECEVHFPESPATVANDLREVQPDWVHAPPRFWEKLRARTESIAMVASPLSRRLYRDCINAASSGWLTSLSRRHILRSMGLAQARCGYSGGAPVAPSLQRWFDAIGMPLADVYESAETCGPALLQPMGTPGGGRHIGNRDPYWAGQ
jgi:long-chain acyl-CoA synthetase